MTDSATPTTTARAAAEAIRELNHLTLNAPSMSAPEISSAVSALADLVDRLPQAFEQLAHHLEKQLQAGAVRMEDDRDPAAPVDQALTGLRRAAALAAPKNRTNWGDKAGEFSSAVHDASGWLFNMGAPYDPSDYED